MELLTSHDNGTVNGVEMYLDRFSQQYAVEAGGVAVYDSCEKYKAQGVYDYLCALPADALSDLIEYVRSAGDGRDVGGLEVVAGVGR